MTKMEIEIPEEQRDLIEHAAENEGVTVDEFVRRALWYFMRQWYPPIIVNSTELTLEQLQPGRIIRV